jgi:excisionase family DNA binding protein
MLRTTNSKLDGDNAAPRLLSIRQAAREINIGRTAVYGLLRDGKLKSVKIGRRRLIPRDAIEAFIAGLTNQGAR